MHSHIEGYAYSTVSAPGLCDVPSGCRHSASKVSSIISERLSEITSAKL